MGGRAGVEEAMEGKVLWVNPKERAKPWGESKRGVTPHTTSVFREKLSIFSDLIPTEKGSKYGEKVEISTPSSFCHLLPME